MPKLKHRLQDFLSPRPNRLPELNGPVFVLGSGPGSRPPANDRRWTYATVNGSQAVLARWGETPDLTLFGRTWRFVTVNNLAAREVVRGLGTTHLVCVGVPREYKFFKKLTRSLNYSYKDMVMLTPDRRSRIVEQRFGSLIDDPEHLSNGVFLALLCLAQGASEIVMSGFSLTQHGHAYNEKGGERLHLRSDRLGLDRMIELGLPIRTNDPGFAQDTGLTLVDA